MSSFANLPIALQDHLKAVFQRPVARISIPAGYLWPLGACAATAAETLLVVMFRSSVPMWFVIAALGGFAYTAIKKTVLWARAPFLPGIYVATGNVIVARPEDIRFVPLAAMTHLSPVVTEVHRNSIHVDTRYSVRMQFRTEAFTIECRDRREVDYYTQAIQVAARAHDPMLAVGAIDARG